MVLESRWYINLNVILELKHFKNRQKYLNDVISILSYMPTMFYLF